MAFPNLSRALVLGNREYDPTRVGLQPPDKLVSALAQPTQPQPRPMIAQQAPRSDMLAKALLQGAHGGGDIETPLELAGRLAQSWAGNYSEERRLREEEEKRQAQLAAEQDRLRQLAESVAAGGYSPEALIATGDPDLMRMGLEAKLRPENNKGPTPYTDLGKIASDYQNGIITEEQAIQEAQRLTMGNVPSPYTDEAKISADEKAGLITPEQAAAARSRLTQTEQPAPYTDVAKIAADEKAGLITSEQAQAARQQLGAVKPTSDIQNYEFYAQQERAAGRQPLGQLEYEQALRKSGATSITTNVAPNGQTYPQPPFGQDYKRNPDGTVWVDENGMPQIIQVPGGPAERDAAGDAAKSELREGQAQKTADIITDSIDRAISEIDANPAGTTGWGGAFLRFLPGASAQSVQERLKTIKANIGFDKLQIMRASSPTGGALGQVSNFENELLQATYGSLEQSQNADELRYNLRRVGALYTIVTGDSEQTKALAQIGQAVDRGDMTAEQAASMVEGILSTVPDSGWQTLPGGVRMREVK